MFEKIDKLIDGLIPQMVEQLSQAVQIPSVQGQAQPDAPFGVEASRMLDFALNLGEKMGFAVKNVDHYAGHIEYGTQGKLYGVLGHLDVVPVEENSKDWSEPPFGGVVKDGYVWGRGASDNKGPTLAALYALYALKEFGIHQLSTQGLAKNRIRLIFGTNEETGWECVKYYFQKEPYPDFAIAPDAVFPGIYAEKGILRVDIVGNELNQNPLPDTLCSTPEENQITVEGGTVPNVVPKETILTIKSENPDMIQQMAQQFLPQNGAKIEWERNAASAGDDPAVCTLHFIGKPCHASHPSDGINSISACLDFCRGLSFHSTVKSALNLLWKHFGYETTGKKAGISGSDGVCGELTVNLGVISITAHQFKATLDIRFPIFFDKERILQQLKEVFRGYDVTEASYLKPLYVSPDNPHMKQLLRIYNDYTGDDLQPKTMGGGTYARAVPLGICYGSLFPGEESYAHQANERKSIAQLTKACKIYARLFYEWLTQD